MCSSLFFSRFAASGLADGASTGALEARHL
jgi:hypothetical protein